MDSGKINVTAVASRMPAFFCIDSSVLNKQNIAH